MVRFTSTLVTAVIVLTHGWSACADSNALETTKGDVNDRRGFVERSFTDRTGEVYSFLVFLPYDYQPGEKRPLLLYLHGLGEAGDDPYITIHNNFGVKVWEMKRTFPFVVAIPQCGKDEHWAGENLQRAIDYTAEIEKRFGTDPERCYVTGVSSGGQCSLSLRERVGRANIQCPNECGSATKKTKRDKKRKRQMSKSK